MNFNVDPTEGLSAADRAVSPRAQVWELLEFYGDGQYAGKSHMKVPRRKIGTLNDCVDMEVALRKFATKPGAYFVEILDGRDTITSQPFEFNPSGQTVETGTVNQTPMTQNATVQPTQDASSARSIHGATEMVRAIKEFSREVSPPTPPVTHSMDVEEIVRRTRNELKDDITAAIQAVLPQRSTQPEKSDIERVRDVLMLQRELKEMDAASQPPQQPQVDPLDLALKMVERVNAFNDYVRPPNVDPDASTFDKVLPMLQPVVPQVVNALSNFAAGFAQSRGVAPMSTPTNGAQANGAASSDALNQVFGVVVGGITSNAPSSRAVSAIRQLESQHPEYAPNIQALKIAPANLVVQQLSTIQGWQLISKLPHATAWIQGLQNELRNPTQTVIQTPEIIPDDTPNAAPPVEENPFDVESTKWLSCVLDDCRAGASVAESTEEYFSLIEEFRETEPDRVAALEALIQQPPETIAQMLSGFQPHLSAFLNEVSTLDFIRKLQTEIVARREIQITQILPLGERSAHAA